MAQTRFTGPVKSDAGFRFDTNATMIPDVGDIVWNAEDGTIDVGLPNDVTMQVGQEMFFLARNQTGDTIPNGTVVMFAGALGNSGRLLMQPAIASSVIPPIYVMGVLTHDVPNGSNGYVTEFGLVRRIDTRGGAEDWQDGDILYVSNVTAGSLTNIPPAAPAPAISVAAVTNAATNGNIFVRPTFPSAIRNLSDVRVTNPQNGDTLKYNASGGYWYNTP